MKKLALLLGSLLVVSAATSAKELVPAPVVVEEAPVQIVEKEVIVYRDREVGFRPNGYVDLEYRYYGDTENKGHSDEWNSNNNYSRTQLQGKINMTENQALDYRVRAYNSVDHTGRAGSKGNGTETRLRYFYNHSDNVVSRFDYQNKSASQELAYNLFYDWTNEHGTAFTVGPRFKYNWNKRNNDEYTLTAGLYMLAAQQLPLGFSAELEIDGLDYVYSNKAFSNAYESSYKPDALNLGVGAYLKQATPLYADDNLAISWLSEGGYDTYNWSNRELVSHNLGKDSEYCSYSAYISTELNANYKLTDFISLNAGVGAEYRNWMVDAQENAKDWRWQPFTYAGIKTVF